MKYMKILLKIVWILFLRQISGILRGPCEGSSKCTSLITQNMCNEGEYLELDYNIDCCPRCRGGIGFGVSGCNDNNERRRCAPGLQCTNATCQLNKKMCSYTYHLRHLQVLPSCELDGTFSSKQCKGDKVSGRCFCYSEQGDRIFGWDWWRNSENMTCACSRQRAKLESQGRLDVTLHCTQNGNYEELQCDSDVCWCAESKTGSIRKNTRAVPISMWKILPCYDARKMGTSYLRECESGKFAQNILRQALLTHGTNDVSFSNIQCAYDGSYGTYTIENGIAACIWRDGKRIGSYQVNSNSVGSMNCYCARDQKIFAENGMSLTLSCSGNGNYDPVQDINGQVFCIDDDGFAVTNYFDTAIGLDCNPYLYTKVTEPIN